MTWTSRGPSIRPVLIPSGCTGVRFVEPGPLSSGDAKCATAHEGPFRKATWLHVRVAKAISGGLCEPRLPMLD